jgi:hypothetical protein
MDSCSYDVSHRVSNFFPITVVVVFIAPPVCHVETNRYSVIYLLLLILWVLRVHTCTMCSNTVIVPTCSQKPIFVYLLAHFPVSVSPTILLLPTSLFLSYHLPCLCPLLPSTLPYSMCTQPASSTG